MEFFTHHSLDVCSLHLRTLDGRTIHIHNVYNPCHSNVEDEDLSTIPKLVNSHFGRKPDFNPFTPTSPSGPPPAPAPFASSSRTPGPSAPAPVNTPIYPTQPPGTGPTSGAYMQPSGTGPTPAVNTNLGVHNQPAYTPLSGTGPTPAAAYTQPSGIKYTPAPYASPADHT